jgi:hypothetical protein
MSTIGGLLANPASQYSLFEDIAFFKEYPYALPGFVSGAFCLSTAILSFTCLDEVSIIHTSSAEPRLTSRQTLPTKIVSEDGQEEPEMTTWELLKQPSVGIVLYIYSHVMLQALAYTAGAFRLIKNLPSLTLTLTSYKNSPASRPIHFHPPRRLQLLIQTNLPGPNPRRRQPSNLDDPRLPLPAAQDKHRRRPARLLHRLADRNGLLPNRQ